MYDETMTNEEIVYYLKGNFDEDLFEELVERFMPTFIAYRSVYKVEGFSLDDYVQEGRIILLSVIDLFNPIESRYVAPFFKSIYRNHLIEFIRSQKALKRSSYYGKDLYIDAPFISEGGRDFSYTNYQLEDQKLVPIWDQVHAMDAFSETYLNHLSPIEQEVLKLSVEGNEDIVIAAKLKISITAVEAALWRARQKFKDML